MYFLYQTLPVENNWPILNYDNFWSQSMDRSLKRSAKKLRTKCFQSRTLLRKTHFSYHKNMQKKHNFWLQSMDQSLKRALHKVRTKYFQIRTLLRRPHCKSKNKALVGFGSCLIISIDFNQTGQTVFGKGKTRMNFFYQTLALENNWPILYYHNFWSQSMDRSSKRAV